MQSIIAIVCLSVALNFLILWAFLKIGDWQWTQFLEQRARRAIPQKSIPHTQQPVINVGDLFARMEPYLKANNTIAQGIHTQNQTIEKFLMVLVAQNGQRESELVTAKSVPIETGGTVGKSLDERIGVYCVKHPGTSVRNVAKALKCSPSKVQRWKEKQNQKGRKIDVTRRVKTIPRNATTGSISTQT